MRKTLLLLTLATLPTLAMAQTQTPVTGRDTPRDPSTPASSRPPPVKPDQASLPDQNRKNQNSKDPFEPTRDMTPQQRALPSRAPQ